MNNNWFMNNNWYRSSNNFIKNKCERKIGANPRGGMLVEARAKDLKLFEAEWRSRGLDLFMWENSESIYLERLIVGARGTGLGTQFMSELCNIADLSSKRIELEPVDFMGSDIDRLKTFYSRFGFVQVGNKMIRE